MFSRLFLFPSISRISSFYRTEFRVLPIFLSISHSHCRCLRPVQQYRSFAVFNQAFIQQYTSVSDAVRFPFTKSSSAMAVLCLLLRSRLFSTSFFNFYTPRVVVPHAHYFDFLMISFIFMSNSIIASSDFII